MLTHVGLGAVFRRMIIMRAASDLVLIRCAGDL